jgi:hypothetical protein
MAAADMHDAAVTPAQWMYWATQENLALSIFLARAGWTLNVRTQTITVTGSESGRFELGSQPLAIVAVHQIATDGRVRPIEHNNAVDFLQQTVGASRPTGDPREYRATWDQDDDSVVLNFYPEPAVGVQILVSYIPHPLKLVLSGAVAETSASSVNYPLGFEERIVLGMARRALAKEESDTREILGQIAECESYIEQGVYDRVFAQHTAVRNVDSTVRGWCSSVVYPSHSSWWFH